MSSSKIFLLTLLSISFIRIQADDSATPPLTPVARNTKDGQVLEKPIRKKIKTVSFQQIPVPTARFSKQSQEPFQDGNSGYWALLDSIHYLSAPKSSDAALEKALSRTADQNLASSLFAKENSTWRSQIISLRKQALLKNYIEDHYLFSLSGTHEIPVQNLTQDDFYHALIPVTRNCFLGLNTDLSKTAQAEIRYLASLFPDASERLAEKKVATENFSISPAELTAALEAASKDVEQDHSTSFSAALVKNHLGSLGQYSGKLVSGKNRNELFIGGTSIVSQTYSPSEQDTSFDGSWLQSQDLKELAEKELHMEHIILPVEGTLPIKFLEFSEVPSLEEKLTNSMELGWLRKELEKNSAPFAALYFILCNKVWMSCFIIKTAQELSLTVIDPYGIDRTEDKGIQQLLKIMDEASSKKTVPMPVKEHEPVTPTYQQDPEGAQKDVVNYDAPLAHLKLSELPTLERLFDDKVPNKVQLLIKRLENPKILGEKLKLKNCFLFVGPPGTGKSTVGQIIVRMAGWDIAYAGGGDYRTAFQGSGKAKIDAHVAEAKKRGKCAVFIDEIDAAAARVEVTGTTPEDNRALKAILTTIDQHMYDPNICFICTTNYPEKMDAAVLRRFTIIEIPLPTYEQRKKIIEYYLKDHNVPIQDRNPHGISPYFFDRLVTITEGFSGDTICDMINNALAEHRAGLEPEARVNLGFRFSGINFKDKSILSNLGQIALLPLIPLFMCMKENSLDKHVYAQYAHHLKNRSNLKKREIENKKESDPYYRYAKEPYITQILRKVGERLENRALEGVINMGLNRVFGALRMQNPLDPLSQFSGVQQSLDQLRTDLQGIKQQQNPAE